MLAELYRTHAAGVLARCRYLLRDDDLARDATQDVFVRALRAAPELRSAVSPTAFLLRAATNHCLNVLRASRAAWRDEVTRLARERSERGIEPETRELVRALLGAASPEAQEMAVLYFVDEMTQAEIAETTGRSLPTVRKRLREFLAAARGSAPGGVPGDRPARPGGAAMNLTLGGPGMACSALRVRRLEAGELAGDERARALAHLADCARCQATRATLAEERARLEDALPFEDFTAGVAERLARAEARPPASRLRRLLPLALAAGLAAAAALPLVVDLSKESARDRAGFGVKGAAGLTLHAREGETVRALAPGEPVPAGAALRIELAPGDAPHAAIVLLDGDGAAVLYAGPATRGLLPGAFEWTGLGSGSLVAVLDDEPVDATALLERLRDGGAAAASPGGDAQVLVVGLTRGAL